LDHPAGEDTPPKKFEGSVSQVARTLVLKMVSIKIIEDFLHTEHEYCKFFPLSAVLSQEFLTLAHLALEGSLHAVLNVAINSLLVNLVKFRGFVELVTEFHNAGISCHILSGILLHYPGVKIIKQNL
jgi:hypothetical protein